MGLIRAAMAAVGGTLADQWVEFVTAPPFDEQTLVAPGVLQQKNAGRGMNTRGSASVLSDGTKIVVPENTALVVTDGGKIVSFTSEPGYFTFHNDGQPSIFTGGGVRDALIRQSWDRFKFGGQPGGQQAAFFVNLREIRNNRFGTPGPMPYRDFSLVPPGSAQAPVLRLMARGLYSVRVADPILFFKNFVPAGTQAYSLADPRSSEQLFTEFITAFQAALQTLSRTTDIASLAMHGPELARTLTDEAGPEGSWLERFGLEVMSVAISAIEYDQASRELMDKLNQGLMLGGAVGNAYTQTTVADAALAAGQSGGGAAMMGLGMGVGAVGGTLGGLQQPVAPVSPAAPATPPPGTTPVAAPGDPSSSDTHDPVALLAQLKQMADMGLITAEQYASKQQEVLDRL